MQTNFFTTKENFIKLFDWIKENIEDVVFINSMKKTVNETELLYSGDVKFGCQFFITTKQILEKMQDLSIVTLNKFGVELSIVYSDKSIYTADFTMYNPYKEPDRQIYPSRIYRDGYYSELEESKILKKIYSKIKNKIIRHSAFKNFGYIEGHFLKFD